MYGRVYYENETLEISTVFCPTQNDYESELKAGCAWVESEPRRFRNLWGVVEGQPTPAAVPQPEKLSPQHDPNTKEEN